MSEKRKVDGTLIEKAESYFDEHNLTLQLEELLATPLVKKIIHEKYTEFETEVKEVVDEFLKCDFPKPITERAQQVYKAVINKEESYADDVRLSVLCSVYSVLEGIERFVRVDDAIENTFREGFTEKNEKIIEAIRRICQGIKVKMLDKVVKVISVPFGVPEELMEVLLQISGGMPMMNMEVLRGLVLDSL